MNLHDHRIRVLEAKIQVHEIMLRQHTDAPEQLEAIRLLRVRIVEQLEAKLKANADAPSAPHLAAELRAAKAAHTALKAAAQMPPAKEYTRAATFISEKGATLKDDGYNPDRRQHLAIIKAHDAVLAYRAKKSALANTVAEIQQRIFQATQRSDLE
jgi:hypothetical protein